MTEEDEYWLEYTWIIYRQSFASKPGLKPCTEPTKFQWDFSSCVMSKSPLVSHVAVRSSTKAVNSPRFFVFEEEFSIQKTALG